MLNSGALAVAVVRRQVMIVQAARTHTKRDKYLDVQTYSPFGDRVFLASEVPEARIAASDVLSVFDAPTDMETTPGLIELPPRAFSEYLAYSERQQRQLQDMWCAWTAKH
ncbi:hypothetical protein AN958_08290 [Leucoagaricus sp. SymC.cos]|nr:hypothetical protein AN958_08290 [Leucoagaricus sp. SymC.cos]